MPKGKIIGISEALKEQAQERFNSVTDTEKGKDSVSDEKIRKNFYIEKHLVKLLRKMAYEEETDQTKIVNEALASFFKERGYI